VRLRDVSRFGTFVDGVRVDKNQPKAICHQTRFRFGTSDKNEFMYVCTRVCICMCVCVVQFV